MIKRISLALCTLALSFAATAQTYSNQVEIVTFDSADDGQTHGMFDPSTEPNPYSINQGYSLPTLWNGGNVPTWTDTYVLGPQLPSFPSFGCSSIPGASTILDFLGLDCSDFDFPGFSAAAGLFFDMTATAELDIDFVGFGEDSMRIVYPAEITTNRPDDNSFEAGDWINLTTDYQLNSTNARLDTYYPSTGHIEGWLDFDLETDVSIGFDLNIFGLTYNLQYPLVSASLEDFLEDVVGLSDSRFPIYKVDSVRSYCWGEVNYFDPLGPGVIGEPGWFPNLPTSPINLQSIFRSYPECSFPYDQIPNYCQFGQFYDDQLPLSITQGPITGDLDLPNVTTTATFGTRDMHASGFDEYTRISLSIPDLVAMIVGEVPCGCAEPPVVPATVCPDATTSACMAAREAIVFALEHLTFEAAFDLPGFDDDLEVSWALFTAALSLVQENHVDVHFTPTIYGRYDLPVAVDYQVYDTLGSLYASGQGNTINYLVGEQVRIKYPCHFTELAIERAYNMDGQVATWIGDEYSLQFAMTAGGVAFQIPGFNLFPGYTFSESIPYPDVCWTEECCCGICVDIPYPCISYYQLTVSFPSVTIPTISFNTCSDVYSLIPGVNEIDFPTNADDTGDCDSESGAFIVYEETILHSDNTPLGDLLPYWYENTWSFEGFVEEYGSTLIIKAKPFSVAIDSTLLVDVSCFGGTNGTIGITTTNGSPGFTYSWVGPNGFTSTNSNLTGLAEGEYFLTVTDVNGCQAVTGATLEQPSALTLSADVTDVLCNGDANGSISTLVSGGQPTYTYSWDTNPASGVFSTAQNATGLSAGDYTLTVTDAKGCQIINNYTVNEPSPLVESSPALIMDVACFGESTGSIDVSIGGGTEPYTYTWTPGSQTTQDLTGIPQGNYSLLVEDANGCTINPSYTVNEPTDLVLSSTSTAVDCYGNNTGSIDLTVSGGTPGTGYAYQWYNQTGAMSSTITEDPANLFAGTHTVVVTDQNGCSDTLETVVTQPDQLVISDFVITDLDCFNVPIGAIDITVSGGIVGTYTYNWTTPNGAGLVATDEDQTGLNAGDYSVTVTDANSCTVNGNYVVTEPAAALTATYSTVDVKCFGDPTGSIDLAVDGGTAPYSYAWSTVGGSGLIASDEDQTDLTAGTYDVVITDANGCQFNVSIVIGQPAAPLALSETHADVLCYGGNDGSIDLSVTGGTAPYNYQWSNSASIILTATTEDLTTLPSDTYSVLVTDANECTATLTVLVAQPSAPLALTNVNTDVDCNANATGAIDLTVTGGTAGYTYDWDNDGVGDNDDTEDLSAIVAGQYNVIVTDLNGCQESLSTTINEPALPITPTVTTTPVLCFGDATGSIDLEVIGGTQPYTYDWDNDGTGDNDDDQDIDMLLSGFYQVTITDANGCTMPAGGFISQPAQPLTITPTVIDPSCYGYSDGSINLAITGGTAPYYVEWGDTNEFLLNNPSELLSNLHLGDYFFRVTDENGCLVEQYINVGQPDTINVDITVTDVTCFGGSDGAIDLAPTGGTTPYGFVWSNGSTIQNQNNLTSGDYSFVLTDAQGCEYEGAAFVDQSAQIVVAEQIVPLSCIDQTDAEIDITTTGGVQPYTWLWSNGDVDESLIGVGAGDYTLVVTDDYGCVQSFDFTIDPSTVECVNPPNTFTPNGDNYNDTWIIENIELYPNAEVRIFNRWGNLLYESVGDYTPWDGVLNGNPLPSEVYYYIIKLNNGVDNQYNGTVTIIR